MTPKNLKELVTSIKFNVIQGLMADIWKELHELSLIII
jgi:hypothetical protein